MRHVSLVVLVVLIAAGAAHAAEIVIPRAFSQSNEDDTWIPFFDVDPPETIIEANLLVTSYFTIGAVVDNESPDLDWIDPRLAYWATTWHWLGIGEFEDIEELTSGAYGTSGPDPAEWLALDSEIVLPAGEDDDCDLAGIDSLTWAPVQTEMMFGVAAYPVPDPSQLREEPVWAHLFHTIQYTVGGVTNPAWCHSIDLGRSGQLFLVLTVPGCDGDVDGDDIVGQSDLVEVLSRFGIPCPGECPADIDRDDVVGFSDLQIVLSYWGPCP